MSLSKKKLELVQMILNTERSSVLEKIESILKGEQESDWWDDLSESEKLSIEKGIEEADKGNLIPHSEIMKEVKAKYKLD